MPVPHRLPRGHYRAPARCFFTICCYGRARWFANPELAGMVSTQLLRTAADYRVAVHAYCLMPDHLHALCETVGGDDLQAFLHMFKQRSAREFARRRDGRLWQRSYFDRHLRADEDMTRVARYILANPVHAGLAVRPEDYPHSGSSTMPIADLLASLG